MIARHFAASLALAAGGAGLSHAPAFAADAAETADAATAETAVAVEATEEAPAAAAAPVVIAQSAQSAAPRPFILTRPVFDDTWATIGLGAGLVPSYTGSNDYVAFPLPLIVGRVGGIGISPNGPGFLLDLNSPEPALAPRTRPRVAFGPAVRFRNDRNNRIEDAVVEAAGPLDVAVEVGGNVQINFPGVLKRFDQLSVGVQARWDVLGAHEGMIIEPQVSYRALVGRALTMQVQVSAEFVDDNFADYYFSVSPEQAAASGLPQFGADGGLNRVGSFALLAYDLDANPLNGGWSLTVIGGYSRLLGDAADTPYTATRGDPNQVIAGLGAAFTF